MNNDFLKRLYWACSDLEFSFEEGLNLGELYEQTDKETETERAFEEALNHSALAGTEQEDDVFSAHLGAKLAAEECGFVNGFRLGMKLAGELRGEAGET